MENAVTCLLAPFVLRRMCTIYYRNFISTSTIRVEAGLTNEMDQYERKAKARQLMGMVGDPGGKRTLVSAKLVAPFGGTGTGSVKSTGVKETEKNSQSREVSVASRSHNENSFLLPSSTNSFNCD